jgi:phage terminase large subunit-like protein
VLRKRMQYPELKRAVRDQRQAFEASLVLIEGKAFSTQLIQDRLHAVISHRSRQDHAHARQAAMIENGFVHLATDAAWLAGYLHELTAFPRRGATTTSTRPHKCSTG